MSELELLRQIARLERRLSALETGLPVPSISGWHSAIEETWAYASSTTFTIAEDVTDRYQPGDFVRFKQGSGFLYGCITSVTYSSPNTTVTISGDAIANATITDNYYSKILSPQGADLGDFDADQFGSGDAADGEVLTADGTGGAAWEAPGITFVPLATPLTSTSWDGDAYGTANNGTIDLSAVFGVPAGIKAVSVRVSVKASSTGVVFSLRTTSGVTNALVVRTQVANLECDGNGIVPCDANGDIYAVFSATNTGTYLVVTGYWI